MDRSRKALATLGVLLGTTVVGAAAAAAVDGGTDGSTEESTTSTEGGSSTTSAPAEDTSTTTVTDSTLPDPTVPDSSAPDSTTSSSTTTSAPDDPGSEYPLVGAEAYGLCNAFAARAQPGNSQGWQRLQDAAGGDVDAYCAEVFAVKQAERNSGPDTEAEEPEENKPRATTDSANTTAPTAKAKKPDPNGNGAREVTGEPNRGRGNAKKNR
ncbi:MAG: hypothetical protein ACR2OH_10135 [Microthrixaceae bacterium]